MPYVKILIIKRKEQKMVKKQTMIEIQGGGGEPEKKPLKAIKKIII